MLLVFRWLACFVLVAGCDERAAGTVESGGAADSTIQLESGIRETGGTGAPTAPYSVAMTVTLDGAPVEGATVMQGGGRTALLTDAAGQASLLVDPSIPGDQYAVASHPEARNAGLALTGQSSGAIALLRYDPSDNEAYTFREGGPEDHAGSTTEQCSHCHIAIHHTWYDSPHRTSASNPAVQAVYQGLDFSVAGADSCGGTWKTATAPGTGEATEACGVADAVATSGTFGGCADCHAPAINGALGGRDLLDAREFEYSEGVTCDFCHHVQSLNEGSAPGVGGWLHLVRPSEPSISPVFGEFSPLTFGPFTDVLNPNMGAAQSDLLHEPAFCGGCHQFTQPVLVPGAAADLARWPDGTLPIHTTFQEWQEGPMNPSAPCQSCHMPPSPDMGNSADLYSEIDVDPGVAAGWERPPGSIRLHAWWGPRQPEGGMLGLAASVHVSSQVEGGVLTATVTVKNVGPGHAIPTGEPLRTIVLQVAATCDGVALPFVGGDVVPDFGGALAVHDAPVALDHFEEAEPGMLVRFVRADGWYEYSGFGPFGDGRFAAEDKGLPRWEWLGEATVLAVAAEGALMLDAAVPAEAERAYLVDAPVWPEEGVESVGVAGAPGFAFARVLVGADGTRGVPHHLAVDVVSDNRILPTESVQTEHRFASSCDNPTVDAIVVYRAFPVDTARRYGWSVVDQVMTEEIR